MTRIAHTASNCSDAELHKMSMEEKFHLMDELYRKAVEDGTFNRHLQARKRGVEEVARRWQRLRERLLPNCPTGARQ